MLLSILLGSFVSNPFLQLFNQVWNGSSFQVFHQVNQSLPKVSTDDESLKSLLDKPKELLHERSITRTQYEVSFTDKRNIRFLKGNTIGWLTLTSGVPSTSLDRILGFLNFSIAVALMSLKFRNVALSSFDDSLTTAAGNNEWKNLTSLN